VTTPLSLVAPAMMPILFIMALMADSFAGERERHTLETLLATRLSDQAILLGKMTAGILYACIVLIVTLGLALLSNNIMYGQGRLLMFPTRYLVPILTFDFLLVLLLSCIGVFVSLRAPTVRHAMQTLNLGLVIVIWGSFFGIRALPLAWQGMLLRFVAGEHLLQIELIGGILLIVADIAFLSATRSRFRRDRLILD